MTPFLLLDLALGGTRHLRSALLVSYSFLLDWFNPRSTMKKIGILLRPSSPFLPIPQWW